MNKIKAIVLDFDGVITDSNALKQKAFFDLFNDLDSKDKMDYVLKNKLGRSRYEILREVFSRTGKKQSEIDNLVNEYVVKYDDAVQAGIFSSGLFPGVLEFLEKFSEKYPLYLNSDTPEEALKKTAKNLGIEKFFKGICGFPATKEENLQKVIGETDAKGEEILVIGDGEVDYQSARAFNCRFIGIANDFNNWDDKNFPVVKSLNEAGDMIKSKEL
jgi:phosphoglycolate phosphatase-like HAD superfamily hydrolase